MNDAGGECLEQHVKEEDGRAEDLPKAIERNIQNDRAHLDPSRWWFASSAFPMIAATLGPVANAFSILALVRPWRQRIPPGSNITIALYQDDPVWLLAINACQLAMALIANLFLLLNMTRRIRFTIAQPVTIVGWYLSAILLIALLCTAVGPLQLYPEIEYVWSQAFYYGMYGAILYFITASLMVVTFAGAQAGKYDKDFQLTNAQRTLMLQTIMFLMYLLIGALVFAKINGWTYLDTVYWADVTLFTVGFGDFAPQSTLGQSLVIPYALIGVISLGLVIGSIRSLALERGRNRLDARMIEKRRRRFLKEMTKKGKDGILVPIEPGRAESDLSEFQRREAEFKLMRKIQHQVSMTRRWYAMATSTSIWICLWLVGAKIFQVCEFPYQGWSYFDGFYFCFVSLTTIGYGDITPVSNAGRSFFVFWSLLALPTMTVLISNAGDTIVKAIRDGTDLLGSITILPGERGFKKDIKEIVRVMSFGKAYANPTSSSDDESIHEDPPGLLGAAQPTNISSDDDDGLDVDGDDDDNGPDTDAEIGDEPREKRLNDEQPAVSSGKAKNDSGRRNGTDKNTDEADCASPSSSSPLQQRRVQTLQMSRASTLSFADSTNPPKSDHHPQHHHHGHRRNLSRAKTTSGASSHSSVSGGRPGSSGSAATTSRHHRHGRLTARDDESVARVDLPPSLPSTRAEYLSLLIDEIARVTQHLRHQPPRKYSFHEWAWYLRLIGEDEHDAATHRKARPHVHSKNCRHDGGGGGSNSSSINNNNTKDKHHHLHGGVVGRQSAAERREGETKAAELDEEEHEMQWSWVGTRSPLMGSQQEAEWILGKLTERLQKELRHDVERESRGREGSSYSSFIAGGGGDKEEEEVLEEEIDAKGVSMEPPGKEAGDDIV
ncbi:uncharacterized protein E0L32_005336 [Thyridium curvatum]|uniref:Potassium channel domain-containing protein n=1 Tax=Thyridium curvatum TaxID=1093900 RepID=A0A507B7N6_9PEZI|nr:uncharacterized protein E0L32_005336 [Thyridium curvatum]TPX14644.1 hypothetical protein E0L32_005336 [Thyridium curvatum]